MLAQCAWTVFPSWKRSRSPDPDDLRARQARIHVRKQVATTHVIWHRGHDFLKLLSHRRMHDWPKMWPHLRQAGAWSPSSVYSSSQMVQQQLPLLLLSLLHAGREAPSDLGAACDGMSVLLPARLPASMWL